MALAHITNDNCRLLEMLCLLLSEAELQLEAAECLLIAVSRKVRIRCRAREAPVRVVLSWAKWGRGYAFPVFTLWCHLSAPDVTFRASWRIGSRSWCCLMMSPCTTSCLLHSAYYWSGPSPVTPPPLHGMFQISFSLADHCHVCVVTGQQMEQRSATKAPYSEYLHNC